MERNGTEDTEESTFKHGLVIIVISGFGVLMSTLLIILLMLTRSYQTFLQRTFMWIIFNVLVVDLCRAASFGYQYSDMVLSVQDSFCEFLAFFSIWLDWCTYILCSILISYLLFLVCTQTRGDSVVVAKFRSSKTLQVLLELGIIAATILVPVIVLWVPYHLNAYGFDGISLCKFRPKVSVYYDIFAYIFIRVLAGVFAVVSTIGVAIVYCSMSRSLQNARRVVKKLLIILVMLIVYTLVLNSVQIVLKKSLEAEGSLTELVIDRCFQTIGKFVLIIGYLLVFHFSNFCEPIKKLVKKKTERRRIEDHHQERENQQTFRDSSRESAPSFTFFNNPYTGQFTSITKM